GPGLAWEAAGYGRLMARRLRILRLFVPFLFVLLVLPVARSLGLRSDAVLSGLCIVVLAGLVALVARTGRYQRLHSSGLLGIQAAGLGMAAPATSPQAWQAVQSEFTVPYQARVPVAGPVARPVADAAAAGTREVPVRRGPVVKAFAPPRGPGSDLLARRPGGARDECDRGGLHHGRRAPPLRGLAGAAAPGPG